MTVPAPCILQSEFRLHLATCNPTRRSTAAGGSKIRKKRLVGTGAWGGTMVAKSRFGRSHGPSENRFMLDLILITTTVGFFALSWLYVRACERL